MKTNGSASNLINTLTNAMDRVSKAKDNREINTIIRKLLLDFTNSEFATFLLYDQERQLLYSDKERPIEISMKNIQGLLGNAYLAKKSAIYNHITSEKFYFPEVDNPGNSRIKAQLIIPIIKDDNLIGIVRVSRSIRYPKNYTEHDLDLVVSLTPFLIKISQLLSSKVMSKNLTLQSTQINKEIENIEQKSQVSESKEDIMLFISNTVHDIRTPANTLYGFLDLIESQTTDQRLKGYIKNAKESASFINQLTDSILDKAKHEYKSDEESLVNINPIKFFAQTANSFSANMLNKEIDYTIYIDSLLPKKISINALIIKRVLINLLGNAYKFTPRGRSIAFRVTFNSTNKKLKFSIKDSGIGIDKSRQDKIFKAFEQADDDTSDKFGGTGLGLSISAQYVADLGGELSLNSIIDEGSDFYFEIPIDIIESDPSQQPILIKNKTISILSDADENSDINLISEYITSLGISQDNIIVSSTLCVDTTHLFCFEHKFNEEIKQIVLNKKIELVIVEESLFSLKDNQLFNNLTIISKNTYYGDIVHSTVLTQKINRILVVDDNIINILLIKAILEDEYCEMSTATNGDDAIAKFKEAYLKGESFDMIFLDKHLPTISGTQVIKYIRDIEKKKNLNKIYAISITGDPYQSVQEEKLFDILVTKPFKNSEVKKAYFKSIESKRDK